MKYLVNCTCYGIYNHLVMEFVNYRSVSRSIGSIVLCVRMANVPRTRNSF